MGDELCFVCGMLCIRVNVPGYHERSVLGFGPCLRLRLTFEVTVRARVLVLVRVRVRVGD